LVFLTRYISNGIEIIMEPIGIKVTEYYHTDDTITTSYLFWSLIVNTV